MNSKNLTVYKSNSVIEASFRLSLNEQRAILFCISQANSINALLETDEFELSAKDFSTVYGVSKDVAYNELQDVAKTLYQRSLTIESPYPNRPKIKKIETRWISSISYMPEDGKIILRFAKDILPFLSLLKGQFTRYKLESISGMKSGYGIRLYEILMQWVKTGRREVELDWLRQQLQLDSSYNRMDNLKARVIEPAVADINTYSNLDVTWTQRKTGRRVTHINFEFKEKKPIAPAKAKAVSNLTAPAKSEKEEFDALVNEFANSRKRFGMAINETNVPENVISILKQQGRW
jgi:plasmid replication initiation protein